jgi:hypothetical protein
MYIHFIGTFIFVRDRFPAPRKFFIRGGKKI